MKQDYVTPNYDPNMQLRGLKQFVDCVRMESAGNSSSIAIAKNTGSYSHSRGGDAYVDDCSDAMYFDATVSGALVASFAQYLEGLFTYEFYRIGKNNPQVTMKDSRRYITIHTSVLKTERRKEAKRLGKQLNYDIKVDMTVVESKVLNTYWDPHWYIDDHNRRQKGIANGINEICNMYGLNKKLPLNYNDVLNTIFFYRNYVMHNGVEWENEQIKVFLEIVSKLPFTAFQWSYRNDIESIAFVSDELIKEALKLCDACIEHVWFASLD